MIGKILGNYRIVKKIGEGGMGAVYLAHDTTLERDVAMKIIAHDLARNPGLMARFRIEAIAQAKLSHTHIVTIHSFNQEKDMYFIVMEYIDGKTLKDLVKENGKLPLHQTVKIFSQILEGVAYAHSRGVVHRDIKPTNIFVTHHQIAKIGDFGIAKVDGIDGLTKIGTTLGSPVYSSPEQLLGQQTDARTDIYALGMTFYEMLTGELPIKVTGDSDYVAIKKVLEITPPKPSTHNPTIPPSIDSVIMKSIAKDPAKRFQSVDEFIDAIKKLLPSILSTPETSAQKRKQPSPILSIFKGLKLDQIQNKKLAAFAGGLGVVLIIVVLVLLLGGPSAPTIHPVVSNNRGITTQQPGASSGSEVETPRLFQPGTEKPKDTPGAAVKKIDKTTPVKTPDNAPDIPDRMNRFIKNGQYKKAIGMGLEAIDSGVISSEIYLKIAQAYYYDGKKDLARPYYYKALESGQPLRFDAQYETDNDKVINGNLFISRHSLSFGSDSGNFSFSTPLSRIKSVTQDIFSDITGIFKKKKNRKPVLTIKDTEKHKYVFRVENGDTTMRSFIKDIIDTLRK